jgi:Acetyltransferase (GNAT) domain
LRYAGSSSIIRTSIKPSKYITDLKGADLQRKAIECDGHIFLPRRDKFISKWINQKGSRTIRCLSGSKEEPLAGHGVVRPCVTGFKIGPLFSDDEQIAHQLLSELGRHAVIEKDNNSENSVFFIDISERNQQALDLARRNGMKKISETARMYNNAIPSLPLDGIYRVTSLELR